MRARITLFTLTLYVVFGVPSLSGQYTTEWSVNIGSSDPEIPTAVCLDSDENIIVAGKSWSEETPGYHDYEDAWLTKLSPEGEVIWSRCYGSYFDDQFVSVLPKPGGHLLAGGAALEATGDVTEHFGSADFWVIEVDENGELLWQKSYGDASVDYLVEIIPAGDGNYLLLGNSTVTDPTAFPYGFQDQFLVIKIDPNGNEFWRKSYGGSAFESLHSGFVNADMDIILAGGAQSDDGDVVNHTYFGDADAWFLQTDSAGNIITSYCTGDLMYQAYGDILPAPDDGYYAITTGLLGGDCFDAYCHDYQLCKVNDDGIVLWQKKYGGVGYDGPWKLEQDVNGFFIGGVSYSAALPGFHWFGELDFYVVKTNANGDLLWQYCYGGTEIESSGGGFDIISDKMGGFILVGSTESIDGDISFPLGSSDGLVVKVKCDGVAEIFAEDDTVICAGDTVHLYTPYQLGAATQWFKDGNPIPFATDTTLLCFSAGEYYAEVTSESFCITRSEKIHIVDTCGPVVIEEMPFTVFPNPAYGSFVIKCVDQYAIKNAYSVTIMSARGAQLVRYLNLSPDQPFTCDVQLEDGMYFVLIEDAVTHKQYCLPLMQLDTD